MLETTARRASVGEVERRRFGAGAGAGGAESLLEAADDEAHMSEANVPVGIAQPGAMWTSIFFFFCGRNKPKYRIPNLTYLCCHLVPFSRSRAPTARPANPAK